MAGARNNNCFKIILQICQYYFAHQSECQYKDSAYFGMNSENWWFDPPIYGKRGNDLVSRMYTNTNS